MKNFAVIGNPIAHSKSPDVFGVFFRRYGLNSNYLRIKVENASEILPLISKYNISGFNVTSPFKESILNLIHDADNISKRTGSVNLVLNKNGVFYGFNTDVYGIQHSLVFNNVNVQDQKCIVLGAGGAARSAVFALQDLGAEVFICNRTDEKAENISSYFGCGLIKYCMLKESLSGIYLMVAAVPELTAEIKEELKHTIVFEADYRNPQFKGICKKHIDGHDWLINQAVKSFEIFCDLRSEDRDVKKEIMSTEIKENIALIGPTGTGKSVYGKIVAEKYKMKLIDTDQEVENKTGMKIAEIFRIYGEEYFRKAESEIIAESACGTGKVIVPGAGALASGISRNIIKRNCFSVLLDTETDIILSRLKLDDIKSRPMLDPDNLRTTYEEMFNKRKDGYIDATDLIIKTGTGTVGEEAEKIIRELDAR